LSTCPPTHVFVSGAAVKKRASHQAIKGDDTVI
jgi:hypothetical protein